GSRLPVVAPPEERPFAPAGSDPRHLPARGFPEPLQLFPGWGTPPPQVALAVFPGAVPQLPVDPGDTRDEAVGLDRAKDGSSLGIDLMDFPFPIPPDPERPFGPCEP